MYYPPELRAFTYRRHLTDATSVPARLSVQLFNDALALLVVEVVEVPRRPSKAAPVQDVAAVIEPRIVPAGFRYPRAGERALPTHVVYAITVYAPDGARVAFWSSAEPVDNPLDAAVTLKRSFEGALREAAWNLATECQVTEVREWLAARRMR